MPRTSLIFILLLLASAVDRANAQEQPRVGIIQAPGMGSFGATILAHRQTPFDTIPTSIGGADLGRYDLIVVDNLYRLQDLNGPAFKAYVQNGGVLLVINPKVDGFSRGWAPYEIFAGEHTIEARITERKHPIFAGITGDKLTDFAESNGAFVGNCSLTEPAREWKVLAKHAKLNRNAVIVEASSGSGHVVVACTRFDHYDAKATPTRLGDNLFAYVLKLAATP
ncbi:MAG: hypothetical protein ACYC2K_09605 [Gemmatimonadales bacterium]